MKARAEGLAQLLSRKGLLPRKLHVLAALGDENGVGKCLADSDAAAVTHAFLTACGFQHKPVAALLLNRLIEFDPRSASEWKNGADEAASLTTCPNIQRYTEVLGRRSL